MNYGEDMSCILGWAIVAATFLAIFAVYCRVAGWRVASATFAAAGFAILWIGCAVKLLEGCQ